jgi:hypothetical protein
MATLFGKLKETRTSRSRLPGGTRSRRETSSFPVPLPAGADYLIGLIFLAVN